MSVFIQVILLIFSLSPVPARPPAELEGTYLSCENPPIAFTFNKDGTFKMEHDISLRDYSEGRGNFTLDKKELKLEYLDFDKNKLRIDKLFDPTIKENTLKLEIWEANYPYELIPNPNIDLLNRYGKKVNEWDTQLSKQATVDITPEITKMEISFPGHMRINMELEKEYNSLKVFWPREVNKIAPQKVIYKIKKLSEKGFVILEYAEGAECLFEKTQ